MRDTGKFKRNTEKFREDTARSWEILCLEKFIVIKLSVFHLFAMEDTGKCGGDTRRATEDTNDPG
jgi:hypothetical protein